METTTYGIRLNGNYVKWVDTLPEAEELYFGYILNDSFCDCAVVGSNDCIYESYSG